MESTQRSWIRRSSWAALILLTAGVVVLLVVAMVGGREGRAQLAQWFWPRSTTLAGAGTNKNLESSSAPLQTIFSPRPIGRSFKVPPKISCVQIIDLDQDKLLDVVVCDCIENAVTWIRQSPKDVFTESTLAGDLAAPARAQGVDFDNDGDTDLLVAVLGQLTPSNEHIGSVVALENVGDQVFVRRVLLDAVPRVSDVRAGDLDGDQKLDLVVTHFGYDQGEIRWLKNLGNWQFTSHTLQNLAGGIHGIIGDMNQDGAPDITALISQQWEQIFVFAGDGKGNFKEHKVYDAKNPEFGSAAISITDLDQDGDPDILYCNGDAFDYLPPRPWPWHGVQWLENQGELRFRHHRLVDMGGAVCAEPWDYDADGDLDIFIGSAFNDWSTPQSPSLLLLKNAGSMNYLPIKLANSPTHIQTLALGDLNADGRLDLVTGGMHICEPYDRVERVVLWQGSDAH